MSTLEFIAALVASVAWPVVVLVLGLVFRTQLTGLLTRVKTLTLPGGIKAELDSLQNVAILVEKARAEPPRPQWFDAQLTVDPTTAPVDPRSRVLAAWFEVEHALEAVWSEKISPPRQRGSATPDFATMLHELQAAEIVNDSLAAALNAMQNIRTRIAHYRESTPTTLATVNLFEFNAKNLSKTLDALLG